MALGFSLPPLPPGPQVDEMSNETSPFNSSVTSSFSSRASWRGYRYLSYEVEQLVPFLSTNLLTGLGRRFKFADAPTCQLSRSRCFLGTVFSVSLPPWAWRGWWPSQSPPKAFLYPAVLPCFLYNFISNTEHMANPAREHGREEGRCPSDTVA